MDSLTACMIGKCKMCPMLRHLHVATVSCNQPFLTVSFSFVTWSFQVMLCIYGYMLTCGIVELA